MEYKPCNTKPCVECPFRKTSLAGWLGPWKAPNDLHHFVMGEHAFPCHMTMTDQDEELKANKEMRTCAGSILYAVKNAKRFRDPRLLAEQTRLRDSPELENIMDLMEFHKHHGPG